MRSFAASGNGFKIITKTGGDREIEGQATLFAGPTFFCVGIGFAVVGFLDSLGVIEAIAPDWDETFRGIMFYGIFAPMGGLIVYEIIHRIRKHM